MRIVVTGFEPFGGADVNMSWEAVSRLENVEKELLPVSFRAACSRIRELVSSSPAAVICVGEAGGRKSISVERIALNIMDARIPDNDGYQPQDEAVFPGGPIAWASVLPTRRIAERLAAAGIPAELSYTAGTYVCNAVFCALMHEIRRADSTARGGFIHVPASGMPLGMIVQGLQLAVDTVREECR